MGEYQMDEQVKNKIRELLEAQVAMDAAKEHFFAVSGESAGIFWMLNRMNQTPGYSNIPGAWAIQLYLGRN